jgi:hypothetical protein
MGRMEDRIGRIKSHHPGYPAFILPILIQTIRIRMSRMKSRMDRIRPHHPGYPAIIPEIPILSFPNWDYGGFSGWPGFNPEKILKIPRIPHNPSSNNL